MAPVRTRPRPTASRHAAATIFFLPAPLRRITGRLEILAIRRPWDRLGSEIRPFFQCFDHVPQLSLFSGVGVNGCIEDCATQYLYHMTQRPFTVPVAHPLA